MKEISKIIMTILFIIGAISFVVFIWNRDYFYLKIVLSSLVLFIATKILQEGYENI